MRVSLHPPTASDCQDFVTAALASCKLQHPWIKSPDTPEDFLIYLERAARQDQRAYLAREISSKALVGYVNANNIVWGAFRSAYLGYAAFSGGEGRGLMAEALQLAIGKLFDEVGLHRVEANIQPANCRSIALVRKLGFRLEGYSLRYLFVNDDWRDHERWALTSEEWLAAQINA